MAIDATNVFKVGLNHLVRVCCTALRTHTPSDTHTQTLVQNYLMQCDARKCRQTSSNRSCIQIITIHDCSYTSILLPKIIDFASIWFLFSAAHTVRRFYIVVIQTSFAVCRLLPSTVIISFGSGVSDHVYDHFGGCNCRGNLFVLGATPSAATAVSHIIIIISSASA